MFLRSIQGRTGSIPDRCHTEIAFQRSHDFRDRDSVRLVAVGGCFYPPTQAFSDKVSARLTVKNQLRNE